MDILAQAISGGIVQCATDPCTLCDLYVLADRLTRFLMFNIMLPIAALMILVGGILLLTARDNQTQQQQGKAVFYYAVMGMIITFAAWLIITALLGAIGFKELPWGAWYDFPDCPAATSNAGSGGTSDGSSGTPSAGSCTPVENGPCSTASLGSSCFGSVASQASSIYNAESGGIPTAESTVDITADGHSYSAGLFQINMTVNNIGSLNCPSAFQGTNNSATVINLPLYEACVGNAKNSDINISSACTIYQAAGSSWSPWSSAQSCA